MNNKAFLSKHHKLSCYTKIGYESHKDALRDAARILSEYRSKKTPYKCSYCGHWHLATKYD
jgi:hypothetical protein